MKNSKKILIVAMSMIMIIATILPAFAVNDYINSISSVPSDMASLYTSNSINRTMTKYYIVINLDDYVDAGIPNVNLNFYIIQDSGVPSIRTMRFIERTSSTSVVLKPNDWYYSNTVIMYPHAQILLGEDYPSQIYVPIYFYNSFVTQESLPSYMKLYSTTPVSETVLWQQAYQLGYDSGYSLGISEGAGVRQDLNLVEHCEQLLGTFVGDDYAHYITPLCLALVVILVYFLFIRWLLSLVKSKNVTRVADIIVCTACIIMLVIMYAPMLDLTIKQAQTVYQIAADTVVGG